MRMPIVGSSVHLNFNAGPDPALPSDAVKVDRIDVYAATIIEVHGPYLVNLVYWNRGGTQCTSTSVKWGHDAGEWNWPELRGKRPAPATSEPAAAE